MQKRYLLVMFIVLFAAIGLTYYYGGNQTAPEGLLDATYVESLNEVGSRIYQTTSPAIAQANVVIFGVSPTGEGHQQIAEQYLASAAADGKKFDFVYQEQGIEPLKVPDGTQLVTVQFNSDPVGFVSRLTDTAAGKRAMIYTVNIFSTHMLEQNPIRRFEAAWGKRVPSISIMNIGIHREQEFRVDPPCLGSERDGQGTSKLGCAALHKQRSLYRRGLDKSKLVMALDERESLDYLAYLYQPTR